GSPHLCSPPPCGVETSEARLEVGGRVSSKSLACCPPPRQKREGERRIRGPASFRTKRHRRCGRRAFLLPWQLICVSLLTRTTAINRAVHLPSRAGRKPMPESAHATGLNDVLVV